MSSSNMPVIEPIDASDLVLSSLARKLSYGGELTLAERFMAITATAKERASFYGPSIKDFTVEPMDLPEVVKGTLSNHYGV